MKCPVCDNDLTPRPVEDITVDVCDGGCGGIWFDNFELQKMDEKHERPGEQLLDIPRDENIVVDHSQQRNCPKCPDVIMMRHFYSVKHEVEVDECAACAGIWLDYGELGQIRNLFASPEEEKQAMQKFLSENVGRHLAQMEAQDEVELAKARRIANIFRFICPSYWIPGKQDWGAF
ncbi:MAG: zf-TFIIB domain-containing protein [Sedimentisphaerales bacterium]|nr:zf-TFIIB domain-containing protein [Sedimentisphaerales bacterium]